MNDRPDGFSLYLKSRKELVESALNRYLPAEGVYPVEIYNAMRYSLFAGGKRLRPILCIASAEAMGGLLDDALPAACALEMIHTYSLIHDDLPSMDNDDFRRGAPTSHKVFGEAVAVLAGDALLTEAFRLLTDPAAIRSVEPARVVRIVHEIATAAGAGGMVGGQVVDILSEGRPSDYETLHYIHSGKTGRMILASLRTGAILADGGEEELEAVSEYGRHIGLAFQISDDILNVEGDPSLLGKGTGSDAARRKVTFPALIGLEESRSMARQSIEAALEGIQRLDERADPLRRLARYILERKS
ncbi:MAG TPA: polyprenyl synthetase family protein [Syntrophales bacterium]|jgi:geranylgeranyl diphosphate synthase type II|nr:polyprenyl synthetase family protein [Syntrophales bacterium]